MRLHMWLKGAAHGRHVHGVTFGPCWQRGTGGTKASLDSDLCRLWVCVCVRVYFVCGMYGVSVCDVSVCGVCGVYGMCV